MKFVEPIRFSKSIATIKNIFRWEWNIRDLLLVELWINSALRISDLLSIKVNYLFENDLTIKDFFDIKEKKTGKMSRITITPKVRATLEDYKKAYPQIVSLEDNYIFFKRKTFPLGSASIWRKMSWYIISNICEQVGLKGNFSNHSLRKTWWFIARTNGIPIEIIQHKLNHSSLLITQKYLGITADEIAEACMKLDI